MFRAQLALALALLAARPASAGIVNVQSALSTTASEGVSGSLTGSADWRTGNTDLLVVSAAAVVRLRLERDLVVGIARGELGTSKGARIIAKTFEHLRYRRSLTDLVRAEAFVQHEYDEFRRLELRALAGLGPVFALYGADGMQLDFGVAYMLEYERLDTAGFADDGNNDLAHRGSSYLTGSYALDERVSVIETFYVQPRLTDAADIRLLNDLSLSVKLTDAVSLTTAFNLSWDNRRPDGIAELDTALKSSITIGF